MTRNAQQFADRLRSALGVHTRSPRSQRCSSGAPAAERARVRTASISDAGRPATGEEFARRLRAAIGV